MGFSYDPRDAETQANPYPAYRRLRDEFPVYRQDELRCWVFSRFADVLAALRDHDAYCSRLGLTWDTVVAEQAGVLSMLVTTDPPAHTRLRKLISRGLTPSRVATLEPTVRALVRDAVSRLRSEGGGDVVSTLAVALPTSIIGRFLGVPPKDGPRFHQWATAVVRATSGAAFHDEHHRATRELYAYFRATVAARRAAPSQDLLGALVGTAVDGAALTDDEVLGFCFNIVVGGIETTAGLIANGILLLHDHPEVRRLLAAEPVRIPHAVEEFLRLESPVQGLCRTTTRAVSVHDTVIPAGDKVLLLFGAANRDDREFSDPDRLDVARAMDHHLAFGFGAHYCIGAALARLMGRVVFEEVAGLPPYRVDLGRAVRVRNAVGRGWEHLPLAFV